jgi:hypothetical protein
VIDETKEYIAEGCESRGRGMLRAVLLVDEASRLLKSKAKQLPEGAPSVRLQKIAIRLGNFTECLERAAIAVEHSHHRKSPRACELDLPGIEALLTSRLRTVAIGSSKGRQLYALRARVREILSSGSLPDRTEHIGSIARRELASWTFPQGSRGAA